ncbi:HIT family protein [Novosphingobium mangrovi (ex Huang et al. 2023)]|uniref:HIT family protein n=1 Tax=Novosphingobium mangrovi (ex Huang et al. 2023) TaxID=2976432 RepID=A0ABT2I186_9SPHN|nr:HIT family protein [Novosphingobium mangrovi (ex Huang et al. 2023)]MCT2398572.1 HIT family protein [Novosphingobium mangrovi (ex Huang et al. 2023)]
MNETMEKFGYPATLVAEFEHWVVLARAAQPTLGSLVLVAKSDATAFSDLPVEAHAELKQVTTAIEGALGKAVDYARINYLMLMMVDPNVHFHVLPRYEGSREWQGREFVDVGWPKVPDLGHAVALAGDDLAALVGWLKGYFA